MGISPEMLQRMANQNGPQGMGQNLSVMPVQPKLSDEQFEALQAERRAQDVALRDEQKRIESKQDDEKLRLEAKQDDLNDRQLAFQKAQLAYNIVVNSEFNALCQSGAHAEKADLESTRKARSASVAVLQGYLEANK